MRTAILFFGTCLLGVHLFAQEFTIKFATLAPEGSTLDHGDEGI